ncbi:MAG: hypothetical protein KDA42_04100 [Planctomycetales bacterium]|nr:hypothetical protein [Planctomycetales bacterium]
MIWASLLGGSPATAQTETQPAAESVETGADATERLAVPTAASRAAARKTIESLFASQLAAPDPKTQRQLAQRLQQMAAETNDDAVARYELLVLSIESAIAAGDLKLAEEGIQRIDARYKVDKEKLQLYVVGEIGRKLRNAESVAEYIQYASDVVKALVVKDQYDSANSVIESAIDTARRASQGDTVRLLVARKRDLARISKQYEASQAAFATLEQTPQDPAANRAAGEFLCFAKGDFEHGLTFLALGEDRELSELATKEIKTVESSNDQVDLADRWWNVAESRSEWEMENIRQHAIEWYRLALPELTGLSKARVEARLASIKSERTAPAAFSPVEMATLKRATAHAWRAKLRKYDLNGVRFGENGAYYYENKLHEDYRWRIEGNVIHVEPMNDRPIASVSYRFLNDGRIHVQIHKNGNLLDEGLVVPE